MLKKEIFPAVLSTNLADFNSKIKKLKGSAKKIHIDIMDGEFVCNSTIHAHHIKGIKQFYTSIHLMVFNPEDYVGDFSELNADEFIFHFEAAKNPVEVVKKIRRTSMKIGLAVNPETPVAKIRKLIPFVDIVLVMTVHPGFGGQSMIKSCLKKISQIRKISRKIKIGIDGGVNPETSSFIRNMPLDFVVAGWVLQGKNVKERINFLANKIN